MPYAKFITYTSLILTILNEIGIIIIPFYRWGTGGPEKLNNYQNYMLVSEGTIFELQQEDTSGVWVLHLVRQCLIRRCEEVWESTKPQMLPRFLKSALE